jgi:hypothetical protein
MAAFSNLLVARAAQRGTQNRLIDWLDSTVTQAGGHHVPTRSARLDGWTLAMVPTVTPRRQMR